MTHATIDTPDLGDAINRYGPTAARPAPSETRRLDSKTVDIHAHVMIPAGFEYMGPHMDVAKIAMVKHANAETKAINMQQDADRQVAMTDIEDRVKVLDTQGIDMQIVAPPPFQCWYQSPVEHCIKGSQIVNDGLAEWVGKRPDRFAALGTLPMTDPDAAITELERCMGELGMKGVEVLTNIDGEELASPRFEPVWKKAEELGALVMIHPNGFTHGDRLHDYYFSNVFGNPTETSLALHHFIFSGTLERCPDLKILAVHGGGWLPAYSGRIDHAWGARKDSHAGLPKPPSHYLRKVYFDSVVFSDHQLEYLVKTFGADKIVLGSDYPYDMADYDPVEHVVSSDLTDEEKAKVAGLSAAALLGL
ncbi:amidohydrolase family protein [Roseisalinus antarcticus]|uniref:Amidohydrolase n=1 Tax=Roseisalinus antarcticus TaxID=254357 RepID=A0A1Y5U245_9RHOB|nr:amidohydrolase family protein [Roseisalinus antarcticus]SLN76815.1 Amidohydrolase [Roseisalinus antarcticus]